MGADSRGVIWLAKFPDSTEKLTKRTNSDGILAIICEIHVVKEFAEQ